MTLAELENYPVPTPDFARPRWWDWESCVPDSIVAVWSDLPPLVKAVAYLTASQNMQEPYSREDL